MRLQADFPLAQVQPLSRLTYADATLGAIDHVADMTGLTAGDWAEYLDTIATPNTDPDRAFGAYAVAARRRGKGCPFAAALGDAG